MIRDLARLNVAVGHSPFASVGWLLAALTLCPATSLVRAAAGEVPLAINWDGDRVTVTFRGLLQRGEALEGPWTELTNVVSPLVIQPGDTSAFFRLGSIFGSEGVAALVLTGPFQQHFDLAFAGIPDGIFPPVRPKPYFEGTLQMGGRTIPVKVRVRGNSSLQECPFPKLKFKVTPENRPGTPFYDARELKIGTHCAEGGHGTIGRLRDERAAFREALVYESLALLGFTSPRVRRAQIEYRDTSPTNVVTGGWQINRHAVLLDEIEVVAEKLGAHLLTEEEAAALPKGSLDQQLVTELRLFHALVGDWDYALSPGEEGLRNTDVLTLANGQLLPVAGDFDLASWVTGEVRLSAPRDYHPELPDIERQALYSVEDIRAHADTLTFGQATARFAWRRSAIEDRVHAAEIDDAGRTNALRHVTAFFDALTAAGK